MDQKNKSKNKILFIIVCKTNWFAIEFKADDLLTNSEKIKKAERKDYE